MLISKSTLKNIGWSLCLSGTLISCGDSTTNNKPKPEQTVQETNNKAAVVVHTNANPDALNPITSTSANSIVIQDNIFQKLLIQQIILIHHRLV